jgi:hypothetical protein
MRRIRRVMTEAATCAILALVALPVSALADFKIHLPDAESGEFEIEQIGSYGMAGSPDFDNEKSFVYEMGYGVNNWWHTELEFETNREPGPGNHLRFDQLTSENQFVFGEPGQYWLDPGFFWEYGQAMVGGNPNETTFGPTLRKEFFTRSTRSIYSSKRTSGSTPTAIGISSTPGRRGSRSAPRSNPDSRPMARLARSASPCRSASRTTASGRCSSPISVRSDPAASRPMVASCSG